MEQGLIIHSRCRKIAYENTCTEQSNTDGTLYRKAWNSRTLIAHVPAQMAHMEQCSMKHLQQCFYQENTGIMHNDISIMVNQDDNTAEQVIEQHAESKGIRENARTLKKPQAPYPAS